ncbi:MAG: type II toxin-antitoxin system RelE/ParE family toxin [Cytophagaceae bacterium]|nr:type II toxin-antitoxin system RelE/ParE family toxin [Cytophagaceae bacterium]MBK9933702.1 type II toxin-antitoxin system RelE/ParE family toxin [Cytophagaceae bacterium]MBL0302584.1 type II toxin-antitoxin system RelE/ParE family toxin [Cytophagaceae bacterium]MBL0325410.1 type II toxin-antitoxin system RelE/ParE family toxin [Cytophagaceae bacterium]
MAKKSVVWTNTAVKQRREILEYWVKRNGNTKYSEKLISIIKERIKIIVFNPFSGKKTNHIETRVSALNNYSIFYKITGENIVITAFWDNRQNPDKLLEIISKK